jgi:hypothetical protein
MDTGQDKAAIAAVRRSKFTYQLRSPPTVQRASTLNHAASGFRGSFSCRTAAASRARRTGR